MFELHALWTRQCISKHRSSTRRLSASSCLSGYAKIGTFSQQLLVTLEHAVSSGLSLGRDRQMLVLPTDHSQRAKPLISETVERLALVTARDRGQAGGRLPKARPAAGARADRCPWH